MAQSGRGDRPQRCPLLGVKRTSLGHASMSAFDPKRTSIVCLLPIMVLKESSALIAEAELRLVEGEKRIRKQRAIVTRLSRIGADTEQARELLSQLIDAQHGQKLQLDRYRSGLTG